MLLLLIVSGFFSGYSFAQIEYIELFRRKKIVLQFIILMESKAL